MQSAKKVNIESDRQRWLGPAVASAGAPQFITGDEACWISPTTLRQKVAWSLFATYCA